MRHIVEREGLGGLYAGLNSALFGISITNFVYYYWYEWTRAFFEAAALKNAARVSKKLTTVESMIAGAIAGSATVIITNPIWVVNTRMTTRQHQVEEKKSHDVEQGEKPEHVLAGPAGADDSTNSKPTAKRDSPSTLGTLMALLRNEGPKALFSGVLPALVLVINPILQYTLFEQLKNTLEKRRRVTPAMAFVLGALGKLFATSITYPYITVKSQAHVAGRDGKTEGMTAAIRRISKEEGVSGLYRGMFTFCSCIIHIHFQSRCSRKEWRRKDGACFYWRESKETKQTKGLSHANLTRPNKQASDQRSHRAS